ncbi:MAG: FAD/NAD(P)-binding protein [Armatimonadota bacterium]|nr:FAD/NAD(P)-binding protein [bacterium]MDW8322260.1 FAD/NAD(P)-binding protein [Armatimonadota bacterium]
MVPRPFRLQQVRRETHDTFTLELEPVDGCDGFCFRAGQFNMLYVFGVGEIPISISSDPTTPRVLMHTTREVGTVTKAMGKLRRGDVIGVRGPFGTPWPIEQAEGADVVIVAGGIGLAPLRSALYQLLARRDRYGKIVLLYGTRTPNDILYRRELQRWRAQFDLEVYITVDRAMSGWKGNVGVVTALIPRAPFDARNTVALVCGPEIMMRFTVMELQRRGVSPQHIYVSMERNMKCGVGVCGHCQLGPYFVCRDGPVFPYDKVQHLLEKREI